MTRANTVKRLLPVIVLAGLAIAFFASGLNRYLTWAALHDNDLALHAFVGRHPILAPVAFVVAYALVIALSVPGGAVMTVSGGFLFGLWFGALLTIIGATSGAIIVFLLARFVVSDLVRQRAGPLLKRMADGFARNAFSYLLFLRLVPLFPFWAVNLVPAFAGIGVSTFAVATLIGIIPGTLAYASIGSDLGAYFAANAGVPLGQVFSPKMLALRIGLAAIALLPIIVKWAKKRMQ
ncbi:MAG: TVP38/TMEM64 family protein [Alphaproteobacteria bacterium]|nr:TVP38/TMEM64 family protein [Alphaproteobacteria bacterium]